MSEYQKQCPIDGGTCGQGGTCYVCENEALGSELTAAKARIAELEEALEPLADIVTAFDEKYYDHHQTLVLMEAGDARRAAALLNKESTND